MREFFDSLPARVTARFFGYLFVLAVLVNILPGSALPLIGFFVWYGVIIYRHTRETFDAEERAADATLNAFRASNQRDSLREELEQVRAAGENFGHFAQGMADEIERLRRVVREHEERERERQQRANAGASGSRAHGSGGAWERQQQQQREQQQREWHEQQRRQEQQREQQREQPQDRFYTADERKAYEILKLSPGASVTAIRTAYRRLIMAAHPDRGGSVARAQAINWAKDVLLKKSAA